MSGIDLQGIHFRVLSPFDAGLGRVEANTVITLSALPGGEAQAIELHAAGIIELCAAPSAPAKPAGLAELVESQRKAKIDTVVQQVAAGATGLHEVLTAMQVLATEAQTANAVDYLTAEPVEQGPESENTDIIEEVPAAAPDPVLSGDALLREAVSRAAEDAKGGKPTVEAVNLQLIALAGESAPTINAKTRDQLFAALKG